MDEAAESHCAKAPAPPRRTRIVSAEREARPGVLAVLLLLTALFGARAGVRFDMFVGYDGLVPQGAWLPITFEVQNDDDGFVGTVEIMPGQMTGGQDRVMTVELPKGTTKRFTIPVFAGVSWNPTWSARLLDERRRVRAEADGQNIRRFNGALLPVAAAISRYVPALPETKGRQDYLRAVIGRIPPALLPDNPLALDGLETLYLSSERALDLKVNQIIALNAWLRGGGHLIVSIEQPNHLTGSGAWLASWLPCQVSGLASSSAHDALQNWVTSNQGIDGRTHDFTVRSPRPGDNRAVVNPFAALPEDPSFASAPLQVAQVTLKDGTPLLGPGEQPLIVTVRRGLGQLTVLTFAPELEPFRSWKNAPYFWAKAVRLSPDVLTVDYPNRSGGRPVESIFGAMIDSRQIRKLPVGWLLLLLVAYLLVIGPVDQYYLKKLNRQMLTWITFPAYVIFFSLLIYFIGYKLRAGETEWTEVHVVDVISGGPGQNPEVRGRTFGSIYSPVNARYAFVNDFPVATFRSEFTGNYGGQNAARGRVEHRTQGCAGDIAVPVWTSQLFVSDWWQPRPNPPVGLDVTSGEIRVANRLDRSLVAARVVIGSQMLTLGEIPAGGTRTFDRASLPASSLEAAVRGQAQRFANIVSARQQVFSATEGGRIDDWTNAVVTASFLGRSSSASGRDQGELFTARQGFDLSDSLTAGQAVLLAWAPGHSPLPPLNRFPARRGTRDTVFRVIAPISR